MGLLEFIWPRFESRDARRAFWKQNDERQYYVRVFFLYLGVVTYGSFGFLDYLVGGAARGPMLQWRVVCTGFMLILALYFHFRRKQRAIPDNHVIALLLGTCSVGILGMLLETSDPLVAALYPLGLMIVLGFGATVLSLPAQHNAVLVWAIFAAYWLLSPYTAMPPLAWPVLIYFLTVGTLSTAMGSVVRERLERLQYHIERELDESRLDAEMARDEAIEAKRTQAKFIASMSHELRTPLNAIIGFSELMKTELQGPLSDEYKEYADIIHGSGANLLQNINDLLDLQRLESGKMSWENGRCSLRHLMKRAASMCESAAAKAEVTIKADEPEFEIDLWADEGRIVQAITNLVTNAAKFTDPGGIITISAAKRADGDLTVSVADTGIGISPEDLIRIQRPFEQAGDGEASKKKDGLGLGLAIIGGILEYVDGKLEMQSEIGVGTVATLVIPDKKLFTAGNRPDLEDLPETDAA